MATKRRFSTNTNVAEVIGVHNSLESFLRLVQNRRIDIAVAFASKTEDLVSHILKNGNHLTLTIGTINHFSDPIFIKFCRDTAQAYPSRFNFSVDFRADDSLHWKVYLVAPNITVIGSPNLTTIGISMQRDTAVRITDKRLYEAYQTLLEKMRANHYVVKYNDSRFDDLSAEYEEKHRKMIAKPRATVAKGHSKVTLPDFSMWLSQDTAQLLPIYVWSREFTRSEVATFDKEIRPKVTSSADGAQKASAKGLYAIGVYDGVKSRPYYDNGDLIFTMKSTGAYAKFTIADVVIYHKGKWWLCGFRHRVIPAPFSITPELKEAINLTMLD